MNCRTDVMELSKGEGKRLLRTLELKAFRSVVDALRAQGSFNSRKCSVLKSLASTLKVGDERCRSEMRRAVNDNLLNSIAQCSGEANSEENWRLESARKIARVPMVNEPTVFTTLADKVSDWVLSHNRNVVKQDLTLIDIIESKKCQTEANASRYYRTKLFKPLLTSSSRDAVEIAIELEKIKSHSKLSSNRIRSAKQDCASVTKPTEVPLPVEIPKFSNTLAENTRLKESLVVDSGRNDVIIDSCPRKDAVEVPKNVSSKSRPAKSRSKSRPKRAQCRKTSSLQEELSRAVNAVNALVTPAIEQSGAAKRSMDESFNSAIDEWQPKKKKSKTDTFEKFLSDNEAGKNIALGVRIDKMKSSVLHESKDKNVSICSANPTDDSMVDTSQETISVSRKSSMKSTRENSSVPAEKDFTPHTFNLIPASRRLKMVKKKENSNESVSQKEHEQVVSVVTCEMLNSSSLTTKESNFPEKIKAVDSKKTSNISHVNDVVSSVAVKKNGKVSSNVPPLERRKETNEKLENVLPVLSRTKKTLSLLGNIKVCNLNAKAEDESLKDSLPIYVKKESAEVKVEKEEERAESELDQSEFESGSTGDSAEYSTFGDSDSHSVIEYWDHEDDEDIIENGNILDCDDEDFEKSNSFKEKISDDKVIRSHQDVVSDEVGSNSEFDDEIVEEIVEDDEFFSDDTERYKSDNADKLVLDFGDTANPSSRDEEENCDKNKQTVCEEKPTIRKLIPKASNVTVIRTTSALIPNSSATNASNSQKSDRKMEPSPLTKIEPLASSASVSILKLRKPLVVGTTAELPKTKEVVIVSPKSQKTLAINVKNEKTSTSSPNYQVIPPSKCIVRGQTISLANARLIRAVPKTNRSAAITSGATTDLPKVTLYSSAKMPNSAGLQLPSSASKRVILPPSSMSVSKTTTKSSTLSIPKKVCRLYDLMDASESAFSNSPSNQSAKKKCAQKTHP